MKGRGGEEMGEVRRALGEGRRGGDGEGEEGPE